MEFATYLLFLRELLSESHNSSAQESTSIEQKRQKNRCLVRQKLKVGVKEKFILIARLPVLLQNAKRSNNFIVRLSIMM